MPQNSQPMFTVQYDDIISIAEGKHRMDVSWKNKNWKWSGLVMKLSNTHRTAETVKEYANTTKTRQAEIKDIGGFVGGHLTDGKRKRENVLARTLITLDADDNAAGLWEKFIEKYKCAAAVYSTHTHTPTNPRLRFVIPLEEEIPADQYEPVARRIAGEIGIESFDPTAYRAQQLMYWPSTPLDGEYYFQFQDGPWIKPQEILNTYRDWKDSSEWPLANKEKDVIHSALKKQGDPLEKPGIIGAFCRCYTIEETIEKYLSDVYVNSGVENRYTYIQGSTAAGLVIYEDKFSYSHHGTDPTSGKLCNAFDLVRMHLFLDRDENIAADTPINKRPSTLAMQDLASEDKKVRQLLANERLAQANIDFTVEDGEEPVNTDWTQELQTDRKGEILSSAHNILLILENDPNLKGKLAKDVFAQREVALKPLPWQQPFKGVKNLTDADDAGLRYYFEMTYGITGQTKIADGVALHLLKNSYHPVKQYLEKLKWDGTSRLEKVLVEYFGANDTAYVHAVTKKIFTAAVARIYEPGIKFDYMLTLTGDEGLFKSMFLDKMAKGWFTSSVNDFHGNRALEQLQGIWLAEIQELAALKKADIELVKSFISNRTDRFRVAYAKRAEDFPRQCVLFGTTNNLNFLSSGANGNRKFWPVEVGKNVIEKSVNLDLTEIEIGHLWAEAKHYYEHGELLYLDAQMENVARRIQKQHTEEDPRKGVVQKYLETAVPEDWDDYGIWDRKRYIEGQLNGGAEDVIIGTVNRERICALEIWCEVLGGTLSNMSSYNAREVTNIMKSIDGWMQIGKHRFSKYGQQTCFQKIVTSS